MKIRRPRFAPPILAGAFGSLAIACLAALALPTAAHAAADCKPIVGVGPEIARFLDEVGAAQAAGQGTLPFMDVLFGVTGLAAGDRAALETRDPVEVAPKDAAGGDYVNRGPKQITVEGLFAAEETVFRIPKLVAGKYTLTPDGITLLYDPAHTVEIGERVLGVAFFAGIHHTVITRDGLAFFLDKNAGPDPDRCYRVVAG
jgi:hypothetical protein